MAVVVVREGVMITISGGKVRDCPLFPMEGTRSSTARLIRAGCSRGRGMMWDFATISSFCF